MKLPRLGTIKTEDQARQLAIDWQSSQSKKSQSYYDLSLDQFYFEVLANKFNLTDEFKENGII